ncbi:hypothetical protein HZA97_07600 [Candidatus Woesearchaeota archaeon]|nr:hypothetical protein [Candidatus Woesearchaeota archaeon]
MDITTIKLHKRTKHSLDKLRLKRDSYDVAIQKLIFQVRHENLKKKLIAGYSSLGKEDLANLNEWETASKEVEW